MWKTGIRILTQLELGLDKMPIAWVPQKRKLHSGITGSRANEVLLSLCFFPLLSVHSLAFRIIFCKLRTAAEEAPGLTPSQVSLAIGSCVYSWSRSLNRPSQEHYLRGLKSNPSDVWEDDGAGNGTPLQYSCLENPMDRGAWRARVYGVARVRRNLASKPPVLFQQELHFLGMLH